MAVQANLVEHSLDKTQPSSLKLSTLLVRLSGNLIRLDLPVLVQGCECLMMKKEESALNDEGGK